MHDCAVRTVLRAHAALLALFRVDVRAEFSDSHRAEMAGRQTGLTETETTVVRDGIARERTLVAGRLDDLHFILGIQIFHQILAAGESRPVAHNLSLFINAASSDCRLRARDDFVNQLLFVLLIQLIVPGETAGLFQHQMPCLDQCLVVVNHRFPPRITVTLFYHIHRKMPRAILSFSAYRPRCTARSRRARGGKTGALPPRDLRAAQC